MHDLFEAFAPVNLLPAGPARKQIDPGRGDDDAGKQKGSEQVAVIKGGIFRFA